MPKQKTKSVLKKTLKKVLPGDLFNKAKAKSLKKK